MEGTREASKPIVVAITADTKRKEALEKHFAEKPDVDLRLFSSADEANIMMADMIMSGEIRQQPIKAIVTDYRLAPGMPTGGDFVSGVKRMGKFTENAVVHMFDNTPSGLPKRPPGVKKLYKCTDAGMKELLEAVDKTIEPDSRGR